MTCASSSFSPLAGIGVASAGIFLADEGLDVGVAILGVVELDLDAPEAGTRGVLLGDTQSFPHRELHNASVLRVGKDSMNLPPEGLTCSGGAGCMVGLLRQVEDLLTGVRWGNGILTLSGCNWVVLFTVVIGIKELLEPLDEIEIVLKSAFDQFLYRNNLKRGGRGEI